MQLTLICLLYFQEVPSSNFLCLVILLLVWMEYEGKSAVSFMHLALGGAFAEV